MKMGALILLLWLGLSPAWGKTPTPTPAAPVTPKEILLANISSDYKATTYDLMIDVNARNEIQNIKTRNTESGKLKLYTTDVLNQPVTLVKAAGVQLVSLMCENFNAQTGCHIVIKYPYNVALAAFKSFHSDLKLVDGNWGLYDGPNKFGKLNLKARKVLGILIGIGKIELAP